VAYLSSELREHAVAYLTAGLFEHHDKSRFEVTAISFEAGQDSEFCRRLKAAFERFIDVRRQSDEEVANLIRQLEIDIAVDLNGFTRDARVGVFARRAAPIQVNYLGYASTMGTDYYDYIIADQTAIPPEHFEYYSEKVVWLPHSFLVNDAARPIAERMPARDELSLPQNAFVFCCFNQSFKISPTIFDVWMRLLLEVQDSVLWLKDYGAIAGRNLRREAERRGVAGGRLVFAPPVPGVADHLARHRQADLFLDTVHYNAHTTASDALWAGLPVVTCLGSTFAGRVCASLLRALDLPELITTSLAEYEALALRLARDRSVLTAIKAKLKQKRDSSPLFDTKRSTRDIEAAYGRMWENYQQGFPPSSFTIRAAADR
jgi:protein O-GlcNAc transferase